MARYTHLPEVLRPFQPYIVLANLLLPLGILARMRGNCNESDNVFAAAVMLLSPAPLVMLAEGSLLFHYQTSCGLTFMVNWLGALCLMTNFAHCPDNWY